MLRIPPWFRRVSESRIPGLGAVAFLVPYALLVLFLGLIVPADSCLWQLRDQLVLLRPFLLIVPCVFHDGSADNVDFLCLFCRICLSVVVLPQGFFGWGLRTEGKRAVLGRCRAVQLLLWLHPVAS